MFHCSCLIEPRSTMATEWSSHWMCSNASTAEVRCTSPASSALAYYYLVVVLSYYAQFSPDWRNSSGSFVISEAWDHPNWRFFRCWEARLNPSTAHRDQSRIIATDGVALPSSRWAHLLVVAGLTTPVASEWTHRGAWFCLARAAWGRSPAGLEVDHQPTPSLAIASWMSSSLPWRRWSSTSIA